MAQTVQVPGVGQLSFPDGMSQADMAAAIQKNYPQIHGQGGSNPTSQPASFGDTLKGEADVALTGASALGRGVLNAGQDLYRRVTGAGPTPAGQEIAGQAQLGPSGQRLVQNLTPESRTANGLDVSDDELRANLDPKGRMPIEQLRAQYAQERGKSLQQTAGEMGTVKGDIVSNALGVGGDVSKLAPAVGAARAGVSALTDAAEASTARNLARPLWRQAGFASEDDAAAYHSGFRNGENQPFAHSLAGSDARKALTNNNADVGNIVAHQVSGVPMDAPLSYKALDDALTPLKAVYRRAAAGLGQNGDAVVQKLGELRHDGFRALNSDDPAIIKQGRAMLQEADGLEATIGKNIQPGSGTSLEQFQAARRAYAQNRAVYNALQGDELDLRYLGRMYQNAPDKFAEGPLRDAAIFATKPRNAPYVGARIVGDDTALRQAVGGVQLNKPGTWAGAAKVTGLPQRALRADGAQWAQRLYRGRDDSVFAPLPPGQ